MQYFTNGDDRYVRVHSRDERSCDAFRQAKAEAYNKESGWVQSATLAGVIQWNANWYPCDKPAWIS